MAIMMQKQIISYKICRIIIAGSRDITDYRIVSKKADSVIKEIKTSRGDVSQLAIEIVSGGARGVDLLGERYANEHGYALKRFPADWMKYGNAAGPIRNRRMLEYATDECDGAYGVLLAIWDGKSRGTRHMVDIATEKGIPVYRCLVPCSRADLQRKEKEDKKSKC